MVTKPYLACLAQHSVRDRTRKPVKQRQAACAVRVTLYVRHFELVGTNSTRGSSRDSDHR